MKKYKNNIKYIMSIIILIGLILFLCNLKTLATAATNYFHGIQVFVDGAQFGDANSSISSAGMATFYDLYVRNLNSAYIPYLDANKKLSDSNIYQTGTDIYATGNIYSNSAKVATLDANSLLPIVNTPDLHTNLDANSIGLGVAKDPNYIIKSNYFTVDPNSTFISKSLLVNSSYSDARALKLGSNPNGTNISSCELKADNNTYMALDLNGTSGVLGIAMYNGGWPGPPYYNVFLTRAGFMGINTSSPGNIFDINSSTGACLQLTYNDNDGSAANKVNFAVSSTGDLTITPSGGDISSVPDTDGIFTFGRGKMGLATSGTADTFYLGHYDQFTSTNYALSQDASGNTSINGVNGVLIKEDNSYSGGLWFRTSNLKFTSYTDCLFGMFRSETANISGYSLTLQSAGATVGATDKNGGNLLLKSGISTGTGTSQIDFYTATAGSTGTSDNTPTLKMSINSDGSVTNNGLSNYNYSATLNDDATISLPSSTNGGWGTAQIGDNQEYCQFRYTSAGVVTMIVYSANVDTADTDTKFDIFDGGTTVSVKNRLGSNLNVKISVFYN